jgi:hypothetical protein
MKKILCLLLIGLGFDLAAQTSTCTLDAGFVASNKKGIWPDSAMNFVSGTVGIPYFQNLTVKVPKDTVVNPITMCFNRVEVSSPNGVPNFNLPPGLNMLAGNNVTITSGVYKFPGNANTCGEISGTPTLAGTYTLQFKVQPYLTPTGGSCSSNPNVAGGSSSYASPTTLLYYKIVINPPAGIKEEVNKRSFALSNIPNPASYKTNIKFLVEDEAVAKISVYNLLGVKIYSSEFKTSIGENSQEIDCSTWAQGVYLYTVNYKDHSETKRMIVNSNR